MSNTRFGSRSKCPINDCRDHSNQEEINNEEMMQKKNKAQIKTLIIPIIAADTFCDEVSKFLQRRVTYIQDNECQKFVSHQPTQVTCFKQILHKLHASTRYAFNQKVGKVFYYYKLSNHRQLK